MGLADRGNCRKPNSSLTMPGIHLRATPRFNCVEPRFRFNRCIDRPTGSDCGPLGRNRSIESNCRSRTDSQRGFVASWREPFYQHSWLRRDSLTQPSQLQRPSCVQQRLAESRVKAPSQAVGLETLGFDAQAQPRGWYWSCRHVQFRRRMESSYHPP